jgi:putative ABC transport system permease protein
MVAANAVNIDFIKVFGIALSNGLVALSGALVAQYQGFSDIGMGVGAVVFSLAAVIIGEAIFKSPSVTVKILSVITAP